MDDPKPKRPDPGRDEGGSWLLAVVFMAVAVAVAAWGGLLVIEATR